MTEVRAKLRYRGKYTLGPLSTTVETRPTKHWNGKLAAITKVLKIIELDSILIGSKEEGNVIAVAIGISRFILGTV